MNTLKNQIRKTYSKADLQSIKSGFRTFSPRLYEEHLSELTEITRKYFKAWCRYKRRMLGLNEYTSCVVWFATQQLATEILQE